MTTYTDEQMMEQMKTSMDEIFEEMKLRLCEMVDRVIDKVFSDFNIKKPVELKSSEKFHDPDEVDAWSELSDTPIWVNSEPKGVLPLIQEPDNQGEITKSLKISSRETKLEWLCFDCYDFLGWHQELRKFQRNLNEIKGNQCIMEMQLRFSGKEYSDTLTTTDPYGFRLLVMEMSIASWTAMIGGVTWYSPYEEAPLFLLVVNGDMLHVAEVVLNKNFHRIVLYQAHNKASEDVVAVLDKIAIHVDVKGHSTRLETVKSCRGSKFTRQFRDTIVAWVIDAVNLDQKLQELQEAGNKRYIIVLTRGTTSALENVGVSITKVEQLTCFPKMLDGRVKTLHPNTHGGILARKDQKHFMKALNKHGIGTFDVVVVNFYPFYDKVTFARVIDFEDGIKNIDIGGPAMIRAAAKNHKDVWVVVDSQYYPPLFEFLKGSQDDQHFQRKLVWKAFEHVASYESAVSKWLWKQTVGDKFPPNLMVPLSFKSSLCYGENLHQKAAFYVDKSLSEVNVSGITIAIQHHGKELVYNNYLHADVAWNCVLEFRNLTCVIVKHTNPCGVVFRDDIIEAYKLAVKAYPVSAFRGIVAFNIEVDEALAKEIREFRSPIDGETGMFYEIVVVPKYTKNGLEILCGKSMVLKILEAKNNEKGKLSLRQVGGGWLAQDSDDLTPQDIHFNVGSEKKPQDSELRDEKWAWLCVKHVKNNVIVIAKDNCMLGMENGQPKHLESLRIALRKTGDDVKRAVLVSDAFFPFTWKDAVEEACESDIIASIRNDNHSIVSNVVGQMVVISKSEESNKFLKCQQLSKKLMNEKDGNDKELEQAEKSDKWFKKVVKLHNVTDLANAIFDEDFPKIMSITQRRKSESLDKCNTATLIVQLGNLSSHYNRVTLNLILEDKDVFEKVALLRAQM